MIATHFWVKTRRQSLQRGATAVFSQGETPRAMGFPQVEQVAWEPPQRAGL
ncbi:MULTISPECIES: hypothetical protein [unclassified Nostoc]|uniref:hypothetical protein n=1 Tax=unclassified Nostoc TaxID=2593658 RepID=UPI002AD52894|nr:MULTISPECIES: hypothetical protein [unclassified Nostoc]MDZ8032508.1 hypothetical protein [Nostoc sp. DedSLP04]MDZ8134029.1 hypothetical protein [Nostoc sp. DedQUE04]